MKANIESTDQIADVNGVPARIWRGRTANGVEFLAFITRLAVPTQVGIGIGKQDLSEFERELRDTPATELIAGGYELRGPISLQFLT